MNEETIVAVFDTAAHAAAAVADLESAGVPSSAITQHAKGGMMAGSTTTTAEPVRETGFWASLFGGEPEHGHDTAVYDRSLESGSTVVTVHASEEHLTRISDILERHNPIDIDERGSSYETTETRTTTASTGGVMPTAGTMAGAATTTGAATGTDNTIQLSEETLAVGKRAINRGTTRVRRYVVETPVEESVNLREESVSIERRPVTEVRPVTNPDFTDKVIEVTETAEEAVVSKTARIKEEIVIRKEATERTETVRDTVRREDVEITKDAGVERSASTASGSTTSASTTSGTMPGTANDPYKPKI